MDASIVDLPGIYSLSPYSMEEIVTRNYIIDEKPDLIINIVDATNLERNLYLSLQLAELGIPMVIALNMIDMVEKTATALTWICCRCFWAFASCRFPRRRERGFTNCCTQPITKRSTAVIPPAAIWTNTTICAPRPIFTQALCARRFCGLKS